jgi:polyhydroxyalkanoate synthesis regulator phasin
MMAKKVEEMVEDVVEEVEATAEQATKGAEQNPLVAMARKVLLAGMGAVALTQEEVEKIVAKLVERGEIAEQDGKKVVGEVMERRKNEARKAESELDKRVEDLLSRMNVPTKGDIDALSAKITALSKKIDELNEE